MGVRFSGPLSPEAAWRARLHVLENRRTERRPSGECRLILIVIIAVADIIGIIFFGRLFLINFSGGGFAVPGDFACFRAAGQLVASGGGMHAADVAKACEYTYPPPFLFLARPLALLSASKSFVAWTVTGLTVFIFAARRAGLPLLAAVLAVVSPASVYGLVIGQNGLFTSALLLLSLGCVEASPILAGVGAGALIVKPHLGILLPVCFLAARNRTAFVAAAVTAGLVGLSSVLFFGSATWSYFIDHELAVAGTIMSRPWPFGQCIMVSPFVEAHSLGADVHTAALVQGGGNISCGGIDLVLVASTLDRKPSLPAFCHARSGIPVRTP